MFHLDNLIMKVIKIDQLNLEIMNFFYPKSLFKINSTKCTFHIIILILFLNYANPSLVARGKKSFELVKSTGDDVVLFSRVIYHTPRGDPEQPQPRVELSGNKVQTSPPVLFDLPFAYISAPPRPAAAAAATAEVIV